MKPEKLFIVRKYVMAKSVIDAVRKEKKIEAVDIWLDDDWRKNMMTNDNKKLGFSKK